VTRRRLALVGAVLVVAACVERLTAPGHCDDFCPSGKIEIKDTLLTDISRDSAYRGYVLAHQSPLMLAAHLPGATDTLDGRPVFRINGFGSRFRISTIDTSTGAIRGADSARLQLYIVRRDTATHNLWLHLYRLPITIDTSTTFGSVVPFTDSLRSVNIDALLAQPGRKDPVTGDSIVVDTVNHRLVLSLKLDTAAARYVGTDSGTVAYGIRIAADTLASIAFGKGAFGPVLQWYLQVDSVVMPVARKPGPLGAAFASFVFAPPPAPLDSTLAVGGVPSARSLLRVAFPKVIRDSSQIIRATLFLVPAVPARGAPADSFVIEARSVFADFGAKSPIDLRLGATTVIHVGATDTVATDTVKIEVTNLLQLWAADSTHPTVLVLRAQAEAQFFGEISFYPSVAPAFRPTLQVTFVRRFPFGVP
jgi:hypothetical protein